MLISFKVSNYKSLRDPQELSLLPSRSDGDFSALPVTAIYGANASGKSNLIEALTFVFKLPSFAPPNREPLHQPFLLDHVSAGSPTSYEIEVEVDGVRYEYKIAASAAGIEAEQLTSYPRNRKRVLLDRLGDDITVGATMTNRSALQALTVEIPRHLPVLGMADNFKATEWQPFWGWILTRLLLPAVHSDSSSSLPGAVLLHPVLVELAKTADLGITDMRVVDGSAGQRIEFFHQGSSTPFPEAGESTGTIAFLAHMAGILDALRRGATIVVDEFDTSLHPRIIPRIIELFQDPRTNPKNAQLIFSTHDATLLGTSFGEPILNRDEVWFVEKQQDGASELYPLTSFKPRKEHNLERHYLGGSYGGVPDIPPESLVDIVAAANKTE